MILFQRYRKKENRSYKIEYPNEVCEEAISLLIKSLLYETSLERNRKKYNKYEFFSNRMEPFIRN